MESTLLFSLSSSSSSSSWFRLLQNCIYILYISIFIIFLSHVIISKWKLRSHASINSQPPFYDHAHKLVFINFSSSFLRLWLFLLLFLLAAVIVCCCGCCYFFSSPRFVLSISRSLTTKRNVCAHNTQKKTCALRFSVLNFQLPTCKTAHKIKPHKMWKVRNTIIVTLQRVEK